MPRVMTLVSADGAMLAQTQINSEGPEADSVAEGQLREEALVYGFTDDEVRSARVAMADDPPNQP